MAILLAENATELNLVFHHSFYADTRSVDYTLPTADELIGAIYEMGVAHIRPAFTHASGDETSEWERIVQGVEWDYKDAFDYASHRSAELNSRGLGITEAAEAPLSLPSPRVDAAMKVRARTVHHLWKNPRITGEEEASKVNLEEKAAQYGMTLESFLAACGLAH